jgi:hypothetical protein
MVLFPDPLAGVAVQVKPVVPTVAEDLDLEMVRATIPAHDEISGLGCSCMGKAQPVRHLPPEALPEALDFLDASGRERPRRFHKAAQILSPEVSAEKLETTRRFGTR